MRRSTACSGWGQCVAWTRHEAARYRAPSSACLRGAGSSRARLAQPGREPVADSLVEPHVLAHRHLRLTTDPACHELSAIAASRAIAIAIAIAGPVAQAASPPRRGGVARKGIVTTEPLTLA
jgi:hypothetical protein